MNPTMIISALCKQFGERVNGGYQIIIPSNTSLSSTGQVDFEPLGPGGMIVRYRPNQVVMGTLVGDPVPVEPSSEIIDQGAGVE